MFGRLLGDPDARKLRRFAPLVTDINVYYEYNRSGLSPETLRGTNQTIQLTYDSVTYATSK